MRLEDFSPKAQTRIRAQMAREEKLPAFAREARKPVTDPQPLVQVLAAEVEFSVRSGELRVRVPLRAWSLNLERSEHWRVGRQRTREARGYLAWALAGRDLPVFSAPVEIEATSYGVRFDAGNDLPTIKAAIDVLVDMGVIEDDRPEFVRRLILNAPEPSEDAAIELRVRPA